MAKPKQRCPLCGTDLPRSIAHGPGTGDTGNGMRATFTEERDCPSCGALLYRSAPGPWQPAPKDNPPE